MIYNIGILAGGRSSRFGSHKGLQKYKNFTLLGRLIQEIAKLSKLPNQICISLHDPRQYKEIASILSTEIHPIVVSETLWYFQNIPIRFIYDFLVKQDTETRVALIGLGSVIEYLQKGFLQIVPCDNPFFTISILQTMQNLLLKNGENNDLIIPRWNNGYMEPLHAVFSCEFFRPRIKDHINLANWRIRDLFFQPIQIQELRIEPEYKQFFANINTPTTISN